jgi:hypothetical protein
MTRLVLRALLAAGLIQGTAGCIISSDDDDDDVVVHGNHGSGDPGNSGILWVPNWLCPPDAETITFFVTPDGETSPFEDTYDCDDGNPDAIAYDAGSYTIEALPEGSIGTFASLFDDTLTGNDGDLIEDIDFAFTQDGGFFDLAWTIDGLDPLDPDACQPGDLIEVASEDDVDLVETFACEDGTAIVPPDALGWPVGDYTIDITQIDENDVAVSATVVIDASILFPDELSPDLGAVDLPPL